MTAPALLGIDVGTTRIKAGLISVDGDALGFGRAAQVMEMDPATGRAEQDPEAWWAGLGTAVRGALDAARRAKGREVVPDGICVAGHGPSLAAVDRDGRAVRPAMTWLDSRSTDERAELEAATGLRGWALGVLPAARWLERHEPEAAARASWYLNSWEALALRLTGRAATTVVPGGSGVPLDALAGAGLAVERLAPEAKAGTPLGGLLPDAARLLGLRAGTPVVAGLVDAFASFHGARMLAAGDAIDVGGAAGGFGVYADRPIQVAGGFTTPAPLPGLYSVGGAMAATGAALDWFGGEILGGSTPLADLVTEATAIEPGAGGVVFLPYLAGERSPLWDPTARGAFAGLTLQHSRAHLVRAILEAAALAIRHVAAPMLEAGIEVTAMRACGGPARDDGWNQIKADVTGFTVEVPRVRETATVGAAIVAAEGVGAHLDLPAAIGAMTAIDRQFTPDPERQRVYDRVLEAYVALHPAIAPVLRGLEAGVMSETVPNRAGAAA
ncbi:MAG TPA: FGGY-family carbohydrate kinase [Candidatus Limnocylindria bacterium]|nr:FGGY-family carbohydrate kinase [Candidatus Limnocylindria bacterium]